MSTEQALQTDRTTITLIRHGESVVTVNRVIGGKRSCSGLSLLGREQAERLSERLDAEHATSNVALVSSDFPRAIETAAIISPAFASTPAAIEQWPDLGEHDPGPEIDGMTMDAYVDRFGTPEWSGDPDVDLFPGGETTRQFHERIDRGLQRLLAQFAGRHVAVACHGGVVDAVMRLLLGLPLTAGFELHTLNTGLTTLSCGAIDPTEAATRWRLERYNDAAHLTGLPAATPRHNGPKVPGTFGPLRNGEAG